MAGYQRQVFYFGLIVAPFLLMGCGKSSEVSNQEQVAQQHIDTVASEEVMASAKKPNAALEESRAERSRTLEVVKAGCNFEVIANVRPKGAATQGKDIAGATFAGWVIDAQSNKPISKANLRFTDTQSGRVWIVPVVKLAPRVDVAKHFGVAGALNAEFNLTLDLRVLPSATYGLSIDYEGSDGVKRTCSPKANELRI